MVWELSPMKNSEKVPEIDLEELTECPECDSEHIVRDYKRGEVTSEKKLLCSIEGQYRIIW